jgi:hypothetical protein
MKGFGERYPHVPLVFNPTKAACDAALASLPVRDTATSAAVADAARR